MSNKLISLSCLQEFKTHSDAKYQDKLTAGNNISIINDVISATSVQPTYRAVMDSGRYALANDTIVNLGSVTLSPGKYFIVYTCYMMPGSSSGYAQCGFSTNTTDITGFGRSWGDNQSVLRDQTQPRVAGVINVTSSQTFYMLAKQTSGSDCYCYPRCYYIKF